MSTGFSSTKFWAKQIGLAAILVVLAAVVIYLRQQTMEEPKPVDAPEDQSISKGLSDFYREFRRSSSDPIRDRKGDFVVELEPSEVPLEQRLQNMTSQIQPVNSKWQGDHKYRTFKAGTTLRTAISNYAEQEGMQLVWDLPEDFVVKHQFQMQDTVMGSLADIAKAIDSNFEGDVEAYFCPGQRALLITTAESDFVTAQCRKAR